MVTRVTAVDDDGSARRPGVPTDTRRPLAVPRGEDLTIDVALVNPDGRPVELNLPTDLLRFTVRDRADRLIEVDAAAVVGAPGTYQVTVTGAAISDLSLPQYAWDLWIRKAGRRAQVVGTSEFLVTGTAAEAAVL